MPYKKHGGLQNPEIKSICLSKWTNTNQPTVLINSHLYELFLSCLPPFELSFFLSPSSTCSSCCWSPSIAHSHNGLWQHSDTSSWQACHPDSQPVRRLREDKQTWIHFPLNVAGAWLLGPPSPCTDPLFDKERTCNLDMKSYKTDNFSFSYRLCYIHSCCWSPVI